RRSRPAATRSRHGTRVQLGAAHPPNSDLVSATIPTAHLGVSLSPADRLPRTEEARGSNPLTSTPNLAAQSVASVEQAALTACCGRATAASVSRSPARKARGTRRRGPGPLTVTTERGRRLRPEPR